MISAWSIRLNTELARKPPACLEYALVHELLYLPEPIHSRRFTYLLDRHLPDWRSSRDMLNRLAIPFGDVDALRRASLVV